MSDEITTFEKLNLETAKIGWGELEPHFARGAVLIVDVGLDLISVAGAMHADAKEQVSDWLESGQVAQVTTHQAKTWHKNQAELWAVVLAPWVLVQIIN